MSNGVAAGLRSGAWFRNVVAALSVSLMSSQQRGQAQAADALPFAVSYMQVIFIAMPAMYMYAFVMAVLRGAGDAKTPLYFMLLSVGLDIVLNPLFIFGVGPLPRLGITGAALATLIAQTVSLGALVFYLYRRRHPLVLHSGEQRLLRIDWSIAASIARQRRVILSGGLNAENVADAITAVRPYAIDVSSGVESAPGQKDPAKLRALFDALRDFRLKAEAT